MKYLYRVCFPADVDPAWEELPMPGGRNTLTGFWTPHLECACRIYDTRRECCELELGAGTYAVIYRVRANAVQIGHAPKKTGHDEAFDRDEVFVVGLLAQPQIMSREEIKI